MAKENSNEKTNITLWVVVGAIFLAFVALVIYNNGLQEPGLTGEAWNKSMTKGDTEAANTFIEYTDITCSHCADFHNAVADSDFDKDYIDSGLVHMEVRVVPLLQAKSQNSVRSAQSAYCAANQDMFWQFHDAIVSDFTKEYFDRGIAVSPTSPDMPLLEDTYYVEIAKQAGLDESSMVSCLEGDETLNQVKDAVKRAQVELPYGSGVPYFVINDFTTSGFGGDYSKVQLMMRAGGVNL